VLKLCEHPHDGVAASDTAEITIDIQKNSPDGPSIAKPQSFSTVSVVKEPSSVA
jgi:hypothetical protein